MIEREDQHSADTERDDFVRSVARRKRGDTCGKQAFARESLGLSQRDHGGSESRNSADTCVVGNDFGREGALAMCSARDERGHEQHALSKRVHAAHSSTIHSSTTITTTTTTTAKNKHRNHDNHCSCRENRARIEARSD